jgi:very-short-patch-repair endonuclease
MTDAVIANRTARGQLHPIFRGVFALGHAYVEGHARLFAALLVCGEGAIISHATAAALHGLRGTQPVLIDVIAPGQVGRKIDGIRSHHVPSPRGEEIVPVNRIPVTSPSRTVVDLAGSLGRRSLRAMVEQAAVLGLLDLPAIDAASTPGRRGNSALQEILRAWRSDPAQPADAMQPDPGQADELRSTLEAKVLALIRAHEIPTPLCNQALAVDGTTYTVDLLWRKQRLVVEADGHRFHGNRLAFERDRRRDRDLAMAGYRVLRVTWKQVETEAEAIMATIRRLLN